MKKTFLILCILIFSCGVSFAQFSFDKFLTIELGSPVSIIKQLFPDEKWEERDAGNDNFYSFFSYLEPSSVKVSFLVTKADKLRMKSISNGKIDDESAKNLFNDLKEILIKKFGNKYEKKDKKGKYFLIWRIGKDGALTLSNDGDKTMLVSLEALGIPF